MRIFVTMAASLCLLSACGGGSGGSMTEEMPDDMTAGDVAGDGDSGDTPPSGDDTMPDPPADDPPADEPPAGDPPPDDPPAPPPEDLTRTLAPLRIEQGSDILRIEIASGILRSLEVEIVRGEFESILNIPIAGDFLPGQIFIARGNPAAGFIDIGALTDSTGGNAAFVVSQTADAGGATDTDLSVFIARTATTEVPLAGSAEFVGAYAGTFIRSDGRLTRTGITGAANLSVDFDEATISGGIIARQTIDLSNPLATTFETLDDVEFAEGVLQTDGRFELVATGGTRRPDLLDGTAEGQATGLIIGAEGNAAVGSLLLQHQTSGTSSAEVGVFTVEGQ